MRRAVYTLAALLSVAFFAFLGVAFFAPDKLLPESDASEKTDDGITVTNTGNPHAAQSYDGIDISHHQGKIDWQKVRMDTCVKFVYIKATEGADFVDSRYQENIRGARSVSIAVGSYHYMTSKSSMREQFRNFYGVVDRRIQDLPPMIDIEQEGVRGWSKKQIQDSLAVLLNLIEKHYFRKPMIYSYAKFYNENLAPRFNNYRLFLSHYDYREPVVAGDGRHDIWQHTDQGVIDGISSPVDLDVYATDKP